MAIPNACIVRLVASTAVAVRIANTLCETLAAAANLSEARVQLAPIAEDVTRTCGSGPYRRHTGWQWREAVCLLRRRSGASLLHPCFPAATLSWRDVLQGFKRLQILLRSRKRRRCYRFKQLIREYRIEDVLRCADELPK